MGTPRYVSPPRCAQLKLTSSSESRVDHCSHVFCMPCIMTWMTLVDDDPYAQFGAGKTCPACRRVCDLVLPSA